MIQRFLAWIRRVIGKLTGRQDMKSRLGADVLVSPEMAEKIETWSQMYGNESKWLGGDVQALNLASAIASEIARLVTIEMHSEITGSERAGYLDSQYRPVLDKLRQYAEYGCAKGGIAFKPYIDGGRIAVDAVHADKFFPTACNSAGMILGAVFVEQFAEGSRFYTRLESHEMTAAGYEIVNRAFVSANPGVLGSEIDLAGVRAWADVEPQAVIQNIDKPLFAYYRVPLANTVDASSPLGVSVFARAESLIREADKQYSRLLWEFEGGELAIDVDSTLFQKDKNGRPVIPHGKKRMYRMYQALGIDASGNSESMRTFSPALRDASLINGLNQVLMRIEDTCGLARGTFSDAGNEAKTATELKILRQRTYATIADNQKALQSALEHLVYAMDVWATLGSLAPAGAYEISFEWDDSIVCDAENERQVLLQEVAAGILKPEVYLMETRGIPESEAKKLLPGIEDMDGSEKHT